MDKIQQFSFKLANTSEEKESVYRLWYEVYFGSPQNQVGKLKYSYDEIII